MRKQLPAVSVLLSLSFFLGLQCRWPPPVCPPTLALPLLYLIPKINVDRKTRRRASGHHAPSCGVLKFEGLASGSDREDVAVTVELVTPFSGARLRFVSVLSHMRPLTLLSHSILSCMPSLCMLLTRHAG